MACCTNPLLPLAICKGASSTAFWRGTGVHNLHTHLPHTQGSTCRGDNTSSAPNRNRSVHQHLPHHPAM